MPEGAAEKQFKQMEAIINSMTPQERRDPEIISVLRKRRIAMGLGNPGAGTSAPDQAAQTNAEDDEEIYAKGGMAKNDAWHGLG